MYWSNPTSYFPRPENGTRIGPTPGESLGGEARARIRVAWSPSACVGELSTTIGACVFWRVTQLGNVAEPLGPGDLTQHRSLVGLK